MSPTLVGLIKSPKPLTVSHLVPSRESFVANPKKSVLFIYSRTGGYAGQQAATDLLVDRLSALGYRIHLAVTLAFDRDRWGRWVYPLLLCQYAFAWAKAVAIGARVSAVCLNLGQTRIAFLREGTPFRMIARLRPNARRIVSLHGSVFMGWQPTDPMAVRMIKILRHADVVTVLGPKQRQHLIDLGMPAERVEILCNTTDVKELTPEEVDRKFKELEVENPVRLLFLSNLIVSKGYLVYLKALRELSLRDDLPPISAVLCGPLKLSEFSTNYESADDARAEIEQLIEETQQSSRVSVNWIEGARGEAKLKLYRQAHLFVFPSMYPVEAQPLVLLEAMSSGCAVITSTVGEIPFTMGEVGLLVDEVSEKSVAEAVAKLVVEFNLLTSQASLSLHRYTENFAVPAHIDRWEALLNG